MSLATRILAVLGLASAGFAGIVGVWGAYLLATAADDPLGLNAVLGRAALGASAMYAALAVGVLVLVRRRLRPSA
jgi:hypothetical protein